LNFIPMGFETSCTIAVPIAKIKFEL